MLPRSTRISARLRPQTIPQRPRHQVRGYAEPGEGARNASGSSIPILAAGGGIVALFGYYFLNSDKSPASGQAAMKEARKQANPSQEFRDPRDSGVKTLEDKKRKEAGE